MNKNMENNMEAGFMTRIFCKGNMQCWGLRNGQYHVVISFKGFLVSSIGFGESTHVAGSGKQNLPLSLLPCSHKRQR